MIAAHVSVEALRERYVSSADVMEARHFQTIWLLAKGHSVGDVSEMTSFGRRWIEHSLLATMRKALRLWAISPAQRRAARVFTPEVLAKLRVRLQEAPDDGGLWTSVKVAAFLARELGLENVAVQRGWEALKACDMSIQTPRPKNPKSATPDEAAAFKKTLKTSLPRKPKSIPRGRSRSSRATNIGSG